MLNIVCIEDQEDDVELIRLALARGRLDAKVGRVADESGLLHALAGRPDMLLCDYSLPDYSAEQALALLRRCPADVPPVIIVSRAVEEDVVIRLLRDGAHDYLSKDKLALLASKIQRALVLRQRERDERRTAEQLAQTYARYRELSARMVDAQERERASVARELHDGLGQMLTGVMIHLHAASRKDELRPDDHHLQSALLMAQQALRQVKTLSFELRPAQLKLLGFVPTVRAMVDRKMMPISVATDVQVLGQDAATDHPTRAVALRVLQQALINIIRHAAARRVVVRLRFEADGTLRMMVADDGRGFDVASVLRGPVTERNIGLHGMIERAELAGGRLRVKSRPGSGTALWLRIK